MNTINITGNLTANPEIRVGKNDKKVANFTVAVYGNKEHTDFIRCTAFGHNAEYMEKFAAKGARVAIAGSLHTDSYTNKEGNRVNTAEIWVNNIEVPRSASASASAMVEDDDNEVPFD